MVRKYHMTHGSFLGHSNFLEDNLHYGGLRCLRILATMKESSAIRFNVCRYNECKGLNVMLLLALTEFSDWRALWSPVHTQSAKVQDGGKERKDHYSQKCSVQYEGLGMIIAEFFKEDGRYDTLETILAETVQGEVQHPLATRKQINIELITFPRPALSC